MQSGAVRVTAIAPAAWKSSVSATLDVGGPGQARQPAGGRADMQVLPEGGCVRGAGSWYVSPSAGIRATLGGLRGTVKMDRAAFF